MSPTQEGSFPLSILEKGDEKAHTVDPSLMGKRIERPLLSRGNTESILANDLSKGWRRLKRVPPSPNYATAEGNDAVSAGSLRELGPGNGARRACSFRRNCTLADENRARDTGYLCRYCTARICERLVTEAISAALLDRLVTGTQASCEKTEVLPSVLSADGPGVPYSRRAVICRCGRYLAGARSGVRSGCGQLPPAFQKQ